jgi:hypothetical protein
LGSFDHESIATGLGCLLSKLILCWRSLSKVAKLRTHEGWMIIAQQDGWKCSASRFIENAARRSEKSLNGH